MAGWGNPQRTIERDSVLYSVKCLHQCPSLIDECCDLINSEWKRSHVARMRSIENSSDNFPMSLILIRHCGKTKVVGHCKISKLPFCNSKVFVETVVIHPDLRGKGLGKFLMEECENVCKSKNIQWIYLTTQGQEEFYRKLGYIKCLPITIYGFPMKDSNENLEEVEGCRNNIELKTVKICHNKDAAPPPPPLPSAIPVDSSSVVVTTNKTYMKKQISINNNIM